MVSVLIDDPTVVGYMVYSRERPDQAPTVSAVVFSGTRWYVHSFCLLYEGTINKVIPGCLPFLGPSRLWIQQSRS